MNKSILIFSVSKLEDMKVKGNISYIKHYEIYFDNVYMVYLTGKSDSYTDGNTKFISLGSGNTLNDLLVAPLRLLKFVKNKKIDVVITADLIFSWWSSLLVKIFKKAKIFLMPVAMPHIIYESSRRTMTGILPRFLEKVFIKLSFLNACKIVTGKNLKQYVDWLKKNKLNKDKLLIIDVLVDELPSYEFLNQLNTSKNIQRKDNVLLYVGRLHKEKMVNDILEAFNLLKSEFNDLELWFVGSGNEEKVLKENSIKYGIFNSIIFYGTKKTDKLLELYKKATLFISPLSGTSLREAGLSKLPIVCYEMDWVAGNFKNYEELVFVKKNNIKELANKIKLLLTDRALYEKVQNNMYRYACLNWSTINLKKSLKQLYTESKLNIIK